MATLLEKVSTLISANLHALIDQATVGGEIRSLKRNLDDHQEKADELDKAIDALLAEGNETTAVAAQSRLNSIRQLIETYTTQIAKLEAEYQKLLDAKVKLEARYATMKQQRMELQSLLELAKSKEIVVKSMKGLDDIMGSGDSDMSRIAQSIYARLDKATAATEIRSNSLDDQINQVLDHDKVNAQLEERKKRLGK